MNFRELPTITNKQKEIITLIYRFRFINRKQLQRYLKHKDARRINTWLKDLVEKKYHGIIWIRYEKGMEYGADNEQLEIKHLKKFYEDKHASETFINHCISIFEFYIPLKEAEVKSNDNLWYSAETKTEMWITKQLHNYVNDD